MLEEGNPWTHVSDAIRPDDGYIAAMIRRSLLPRLEQALSQRPVVFLHGARQTGKTTLVRSIAERNPKGRYVTLDDATLYSAAQENPAGFLSGLTVPQGTLAVNSVPEPSFEPVVIDEVLRVPDLFRAIKLTVDRDRRPGRFLLTGSANALLIPKVSESLAGRMDLVNLWPLSQGQIERTQEAFIDISFGKGLPLRVKPERDPAGLFERIARGGYPEVFSQEPNWRSSWFESYLTTILQRDIRDIANIEGLALFPRLLRLLADRAGLLLNFAAVSRSLAIPLTTLKRYFALLEATFLVRTLSPWFTRTGQRLVKSPKLYLTDTGLMTQLLGVNRGGLARDPVLSGPLVENFVVMELTKQATWSSMKVEMFHFRTAVGREVDIVLESSSGDVVGIEVKARASVKGDDLKGLEALKEVAKSRFQRGIVLYAGQEVVPFAANIHAVPLSALWQWSLV